MLLWEKAVSDVESVSKPVVSILPDVTGDGSSDILLAIGQKVQVTTLIPIFNLYSKPSQIS